MSKNHLKRINAPKTWPIERKSTVFIIRPRPSGHAMAKSLPLSIILRDVLGLARFTRGVRFILNTQEVLINGKRQLRPEASAGLFDLLSFPALKAHYRVTINGLNRLALLPVSGKEATLIPCRVTSKTALKGGRIQLGFHNGRTLLVTKDSYQVGGTVLLTLENREDAYFPFAEGAPVFIAGGKHVGTIGTLSRINGQDVTVTTADGPLETKRGHLFVLGGEKPVVKVA